MNLYQKIVEVRKVAEGFSKDTKGHNYSYVSGNQVLGKIKDKMNELNLLLIPSTKVGEHVIRNFKNRYDKDMTDFIVKGEMSYTWVNGDAPEERESISWAYYGQQDEISKAYGSALTYSERYFLLKCLGLPTDEDDPDSRQQPKDNQQPSKPVVDENKFAIERESKLNTVLVKWQTLSGEKDKDKARSSLAEWLDTQQYSIETINLEGLNTIETLLSKRLNNKAKEEKGESA